MTKNKRLGSNLVHKGWVKGECVREEIGIIVEYVAVWVKGRICSTFCVAFVVLNLCVWMRRIYSADPLTTYATHYAHLYSSKVCVCIRSSILIIVHVFVCVCVCYAYADRIVFEQRQNRFYGLRIVQGYTRPHSYLVLPSRCDRAKWSYQPSLHVSIS